MTFFLQENCQRVSRHALYTNEANVGQIKSTKIRIEKLVYFLSVHDSILTVVRSYGIDTVSAGFGVYLLVKSSNYR